MKQLMQFERVIVSVMASVATVGLATTISVSQAQTVADYYAVPAMASESVEPLIMLALSNDHQLFYKAFTDYDDLETQLDAAGTRVIETTYEHSFDYVGYFDTHKCYEYVHVSSNTKTSYFKPVKTTTDKYCNTSSGGNYWSGNFLNWATMTRIDQIRKVLYGGTRDVDTFGQTILERTHLPNDAHSFAKYYNGTDLNRLTPFNVVTGKDKDSNSGITICNTTPATNKVVSQNVTEKPLARVVAGNYSLWAANERFQCLYQSEVDKKTNTSYDGNGNNPSKTGIYAKSNHPGTSNRAKQKNNTTIGDYVVRVSVCHSDLIGREDCKQYPSGNYKSVGILQAFGDDNSMKFGLMSGSYKKNKSGGVLRKNVSYIGDEINTATDGTFKAAPSTGGIINTIDKFRIVNYAYHEGYYNDHDNCAWGLNTFNDGSCTNWGNPFAEILLECYRYFAKKTPNTAFDADDSSLISGLTRQTTWSNPQVQSSSCANLSVIAFNASTVSYDGNSLQKVTDLNTSSSAEKLTNIVGAGEGIHGNTYFVGENGSNNDQLCTKKVVANLGDVEGTCPDAPRLDGSYLMAGLAYHANITDLRPDIQDKQSVTTYGITLSPTLPQITVLDTAARKVTILPACRNSTRGGNCGLVDFKIVSKTATSGSFYVNWEDSEQGGDYDQDLSGLIKYTLSNNKLVVTTQIIGESTEDKIGFGFVISGTTDDGFHAISGMKGFSGYGCSNCKGTDSAKSKTFTLGSSSAELLEQPLYYAAKWGGFVDVDGDNKPLDPKEFDTMNNLTGASGPDGVPDNYFLAINPQQLKDQLTSILVNILNRTGSGTAASVVSNTGTGEGAIFQALFNPRFSSDSGIDAVEWVGTLNALFIDAWGNIREDSVTPKGQLTSADNVIRVYYDAVSEKTLVQRYDLNADGTRGAAKGGPVDVRDIKPIWSANDQLAAVTSYTTQRAAYKNSAKTGRYILTGIDRDGDGQIGNDPDLNEVFDFTAATFDPARTEPYYRLLGLASGSTGQAMNLVNYIRGAPVAGYRNRRIDVDGDAAVEPLLLGDIINSSPVSVGRPSAGYDLEFSDETYRAFRAKYQNRRQVVYVGANDGMLHAFNAGFFNPATSTYDLKAGSETQHPLGAELWAYVPYNLLPHLKWLSAPDYPHVYYVDGSIQTFDVNIFPPSTKHPNGWGTILVAGMRFGGGEYTLDPAGDSNPANDITLRSGYVVMDITDPEQAPTVLAEISHPDLGFTTSKVTVAKLREPDLTTGGYESPNLNRWYLVFGSGPAGSTTTGKRAALTQAISEKANKIFVYDFEERALTAHNVGDSASFVGGVTVMDWNRDYQDDAIYFGTVSGTVAAPKGKLYRGTLSRTGSKLLVDFDTLLDVNNQPFSATPLALRDRQGGYWVYAGTGRFMVAADNMSNTKQSYYGIKDPQANGVLLGDEVDKDTLIDTTDILVFSDGTLESRSSPGSAIRVGENDTEVTVYTDVTTAVEKTHGWYFDFERTRGRNVTEAVVSDSSLVFTEYQPSGLLCSPEGNGYLHATSLRTGLPGFFGPLGTDGNITNEDGAEAVLPSQDIGMGSPSTPGIHQRADGTKVAVIQTSTGELVTSEIGSGGATDSRRQSWRELLIDWDF